MNSKLIAILLIVFLKISFAKAVVYPVFSEKNTPTFVSLFLNNFFDWYYKNYLSAFEKNHKTDFKQITQIIKSKSCFGVKQDDYYLRSVYLGFSALNGSAPMPTLHINDLCLTNKSTFFNEIYKSTLVKNLKQKSTILSVGKVFLFNTQNTIIYAINLKIKDSYQLNYYSQSGQLLLETTYKKTTDSANLENPFVISFSQKLTSYSGLTFFDSSQVEPKSVLNSGEKIILSVRKLFNIDPGFVGWNSYKEYQFYYP